MKEESEHSQIDQENIHRALHFVEETCCLLRLSRPCTKTAMDYYYQLAISRTHQFQLEITIAASIFLASKITETERKVRDILNCIFTVTALHKVIQQEGGKEPPAETLEKMMKETDICRAIQPNYSLSSYNEFKPKILEAQQHLLRVLGFDFSHTHKTSTDVKTLLLLNDKLRLPQLAAQTVLNTYHDLPFTGADKWIEGVVYFGYIVARVATRDQDPREDFTITDREWQTLFCTKVDKLRKYASKIASHYEKREQERRREYPQAGER